METIIPKTKEVITNFKRNYPVNQETMDLIESKLKEVEANMDKENYSFSIQWNPEKISTFNFFWYQHAWQFFEDDNKIPTKGYQGKVRGETSLEQRLYVLAWLHRVFLRPTEEKETE